MVIIFPLLFWIYSFKFIDEKYICIYQDLISLLVNIYSLFYFYTFRDENNFVIYYNKYISATYYLTAIYYSEENNSNLILHHITTFIGLYYFIDYYISLYILNVIYLSSLLFNISWYNKNNKTFKLLNIYSFLLIRVLYIPYISYYLWINLNYLQQIICVLFNLFNGIELFNYIKKKY